MSDKKGMILITLNGEDVTISTSKLSAIKTLNLLIGTIKEIYEMETNNSKTAKTYKDELRQKIMHGIHEALYEKREKDE